MVFVTYDPNIPGRFGRKRIGREEREHLRRATEKMFAERQDPGILLGRTQGGKPKLSVEARLMWRPPGGAPREVAARVRNLQVFHSRPSSLFLEISSAADWS